MSKGCFIITGTSRGIGEALAKILLENNHSVYGISRGKSDVLSSYDNYSAINYDLSNIGNIEHLIRDILAKAKIDEFEMICLINNAAMLEPLNPIEACPPEEICKSLHISLVAPIVLSSCFINQTQHLTVRRKIVNISSGAGEHPLQDMSIYCTAKAGLNMFTRCVGVEQTGKINPIEIITVDPGMVDTDMQKTARGMKAETFAMADFFNDAYINGKLQSPDNLVKGLKDIIENQYETGRIMNHLDGLM